MSQDAAIEIYGKIESVETLKELAGKAASEGSSDWIGSIDEDEAVEYIIESSKDGIALSFYSKNTSEPFCELSCFCIGSGLSYRLVAGEPGAEGYDDMEVWMPGLEKPFCSPCTGNEDPVISLTKLKKTVESGGLEAVQSLIKELDVVNLPGIDRKITVAPEVIEELKAAAAPTR